GTSYFRVSSGNIVQDCTFTNMKSLNNGDGEAVAIHDTDNNIVRNINVDGCEWGVMIYKGDNNIVKGCEIVNATYDAMYYEEITSRVTVEDNIIRDNGGSVLFKGCDNFLFTNNTIENSTSPIRIEQSNSFTFSGNSINGSTINLKESTDGTFANNDFTVSDAPTFTFEATGKTHYNHNITTDNEVDGNPIHYYYDKADVIVADVTASSIMFAYCEGPTVSSCDVVDGDGIRLVGSPYSNITADVTNCKYGIDIEDSPDGLIDRSVVNTSDRGLYGIRMIGSVGQSTSNTHIEVQRPSNAWQLEGGDIYKCYNTTFHHTAVNAKENGGGELWVYSKLGVWVLENETMQPLEGVDVEISEDSTPIYSTSHFGGSENQTDVNGEMGPITLLDRIYKNHYIPIERSHDLDLWIGVDAIWTKAIHNINMSKDLYLAMETTDVWKPAMPGGFTVTDIPAEDALEATWDLNTDDTVAYDLWSNITGTWALLKTLTAAEDAHHIDEGLVHDEDYYFLVSAWDEVP
ncbi:MAG: right-handed parallel beta-helix repeat-containing protein, partial [Thermoplasmata archaeon]|nr:right-handed parallel beta-helix repeat-containing protein [Thermoplasmata archaeon]